MHDLVIRNGTIVDGTGRERFIGDVAVTDGVIVAVGEVPERGREEVDATGLVVTPGWVDVHTHYDGQITWDEQLSPSGWHGVTTVVMGNCGVGFAPVREAERDWLINVMEGVEDIPGAALSEGIQWAWEDFPTYMRAIDTPHAVDFAVQVPHSAVRGYVMGPHAAEHDDATPEQIAEMKAIVAEALREGALGFTTSRTSLHKTAEGVLVAGTTAPVQELLGIGEALAETGLGVFGMADEHVTVADDIAWMEELATRTGRPVVFNLSQTDFAPTLWKDVLAKLDDAAARGVPLWAQAAGRAIGLWMHFGATAHPFALHPSWAEIAPLSLQDKLARMRDPEVRARFLAESPQEAGFFETFIVQSYDRMYPFRDPSADYEPSPDESVAAIARRDGRTPQEVAYDVLAEGGFLYFPLFNYVNGDLEILREIHEHPRTFLGLSDGGAHCGAICDAGVPTFMLTHWARDRQRGDRLPLERVIAMQTSETARFYGLNDRGVLAPGYRADLNVIDFENLRLLPPRIANDLPAGGRRLVQEASGYRMTVCGGQVTYRDGTFTGALPGRLLRGEQAAPEAVAAK